jgi:hypothetical protein
LSLAATPEEGPFLRLSLTPDQSKTIEIGGMLEIAQQ